MNVESDAEYVVMPEAYSPTILKTLLTLKILKPVEQFLPNVQLYNMLSVPQQNPRQEISLPIYGRLYQFLQH